MYPDNLLVIVLSGGGSKADWEGARQDHSDGDGGAKIENHFFKCSFPSLASYSLYLIVVAQDQMKQSLLQKGKGAADAADEDPEMLPDDNEQGEEEEAVQDEEMEDDSK